MMTALMVAIEEQNDAMAITILDHNANVNIQDKVLQECTQGAYSVKDIERGEVGIWE